MNEQKILSILKILLFITIIVFFIALITSKVYAFEFAGINVNTSTGEHTVVQDTPTDNSDWVWVAVVMIFVVLCAFGLWVWWELNS